MTQRYTIGKVIGEGSFGQVYLAIEKATGEKRAIKKIKDDSFPTWQSVRAMREVQALVSVGYHPYILQLYEIHRSLENETLHLVLAYMPDGSLQDCLHQRMLNRQGPLAADLIQRCLWQVLQALHHLHDTAGWMHRDVKPDNLLLAGNVCKLADFSLARPCCVGQQAQQQAQQNYGEALPASQTSQQHQQHHQHHNNHHHHSNTNNYLLTSYVSTRWYRAPELVLLAPDYNAAVDLFAVGCIAAGELSKLKPLFPGLDQWDQLRRMMQLTGTPHQAGWSAGVHLMQEQLGIGSTEAWYEAVMTLTADNAAATSNDTNNGHASPFLPQQQQQQQHNVKSQLLAWMQEPNKYCTTGQLSFPDPTLMDLLLGLLTLDPQRRLTARQALDHVYFRGLVAVDAGADNDNLMGNDGKRIMEAPAAESSVVVDITDPGAPATTTAAATSNMEQQSLQPTSWTAVDDNDGFFSPTTAGPRISSSRQEQATMATMTETTLDTTLAATTPPPPVAQHHRDDENHHALRYGIATHHHAVTVSPHQHHQLPRLPGNQTTQLLETTTFQFTDENNMNGKVVSSPPKKKKVLHTFSSNFMNRRLQERQAAANNNQYDRHDDDQDASTMTSMDSSSTTISWVQQPQPQPSFSPPVVSTFVVGRSPAAVAIQTNSYRKNKNTKKQG